MGKVMQEYNTWPDWVRVRHPQSMQVFIEGMELATGEAYITKSVRHGDIVEGMKVYSTPFPSVKPVKLNPIRPHVRVKPDKPFRRSQVPMNRYDTLVLYGTEAKHTKGEGRGVYHSRIVPGLFQEKSLMLAKATREWLKEHGYKPKGIKAHGKPIKSKRKSSRTLSNKSVSQVSQLDTREFSIGHGDDKLYVTLHESENRVFRVFCDSLPSIGKERSYYTKEFLKAVSCFKKWCEEARKDWIVVNKK